MIITSHERLFDAVRETPAHTSCARARGDHEARACHRVAAVHRPVPDVAVRPRPADGAPRRARRHPRLLRQDYGVALLRTVHAHALSFEAAMYRLGGRVLSTEQARKFSSEIEGEQLEDTIRIISSFCDVIVLRPTEEGGGAGRTRASRVPVINAGDGSSGQHPTQARWTSTRSTASGGPSIRPDDRDRRRTRRRPDRAVPAYPPEQVPAGQDPLREPARGADAPRHSGALDEHDVWYDVRHDVTPTPATSTDLPDAHPPRTGVGPRPLSRYAINARLLRTMKPDAMILHPLPRTVEIDKDVDDDPRALYFQQAANSLFVRMALLTLLWDRE